MATHGTRSCYNGGCRHPECVKAEREYNRSRRQGKQAAAVVESRAANVTNLHAVKSPKAPKSDAPPPAAMVGEAEAAVIAELDGLSLAKSRPGLVAAAIALARVLDTPHAVAQHSAAAHRLGEALDKLRKGSDVGAGRLASVQRMTGNRAG